MNYTAITEAKNNSKLTSTDSIEEKTFMPNTEPKLPEYHEMWTLPELVWRLHLQTACISPHTSLPATQPEIQVTPIGPIRSKII